jgi:hypothetical protein
MIASPRQRKRPMLAVRPMRQSASLTRRAWMEMKVMA